MEIAGLEAPATTPWNPFARPSAGGSIPVRVSLSAEKPRATIEVIREVRFPVEYQPPHVSNVAPGITPLMPEAFDTVNAGWTIHLNTKPEGKLIAIYGVADYVEAERVPGGYGPVAGPIYTERGELVSPNTLEQPKFQTTSTRFHIFAVPGESYAVTMYRGAKAETHLVSVSAE